MPEYQQLILDFVNRPNYQPVKLQVIARKLDRVDELKELRRALKQLVRQKKIAFGAKHLVQRIRTDTSLPNNQKEASAKEGSAKEASAKQGATKKAGAAKPEAERSSGKKKSTSDRRSERSNEIIGTFRRNSAGFGFVTPDLSSGRGRLDDIFIPKSKTVDAADMDRVRVRLSTSQRGGRRGTADSQKRNGQIIEVIDRNTNRFVGTYRERFEEGLVYVDGDIFDAPIQVGDAGAKNCRVGDKVVIEMVHFPAAWQKGEAVIVEILGDRGKAGVDTLSVIHQYGLPMEFPAEVLVESRGQAAKFRDDHIPEGRTDFTGKTVVTIDPETARDFDDAISLERLDNGHWLLGVHIADVSHFVPRKSKLDDEAYQRATSVYLPDRVIPMLPEIISNNLASLQPNRLRYTMSALMELNAHGMPIHTELHRGVIKSVHRFTYEEVDDYLANDRPWKKKLTPAVFELVRNMHSLAMNIRKRRLDGGAINLVLPEVRIDLDENGRVAGAHAEENTESHQVIEEFMLAANIAVARWLADQKLNLLRRVHPTPGETKLSELTEFVKGLGLKVDNLQNRFELKRIVEQSEDSPQQHALHYAVLRSMAKAVYSPEDLGHYALNADLYCHFTSPIRRYPDLVIHRMVGDLLDRKKPDSNFDRLVAVGKHCSQREKRAADAERELVKLKLMNFLVDKIGQKMHARITGVESFGVFAQGVEIPAEGLIPLAKLPIDNYQYDRAARTLTGFKKDNRFRLGDLIEIKVSFVNPDRRILEFELIAGPAAPSTGRPQPSRGKRRPQDSGRRPESADGESRSKGSEKGKRFAPSKGSDKSKRREAAPEPSTDRKKKASPETQPGKKKAARRTGGPVKKKSGKRKKK